MTSKFQTTDKNNKVVTVKIWSIKSEEWQAGAHLNCACCGCAIRHIMTIDNVNYGQTCGARELGYTVTSKKANVVEKLMFDIQANAEKAAYKKASDNRIGLEALAGKIEKAMNGKIINYRVEFKAQYEAVINQYVVIAETLGLQV